MALQRGNAVSFQNAMIPNEMSLQPFTLFSSDISACGFVLVGIKNNNNTQISISL